MKLNLSYLTSVSIILSQICLNIAAATADEPRTLAFIMDVTFSMIVDLESVKVAMEQILKKIPNELDQYFGEYMFMPFHDPGTNFFFP